jgi:hypothetical protein
MYTADSWHPAESLTRASWMDLSGSGKHVTDVGGTTNISVARPVGAPAYVQGASTAWMKFPVGILPSAQYTLFYVARYNGPTRNRIFQGDNTNWLSGFWGNGAGIAAGVAFHGSCNYITPYIDQQVTNKFDLHGVDWVLASDRSNIFRSNGVDRTSNPGNACQTFDRLVINTGSTPYQSETSDFAIQSVLVYNVKLSDADVQRVEDWLASLQRAFTPHLQPPITAGLIAHYNADSWTGMRWTDVSGYGNHVTEVGGTTNISVARPVGAPAYVQGASTAWMKFPVGILPSAQYTLFFVARYNGERQGCILQGLDENWLSGFIHRKAGWAYHTHNCHFVTPQLYDTPSLHGSTDWVVGSDRSNTFRSNGVDRSILNTCQSYARVSINQGFQSGEFSDFAIQSVLVYNVKLSDADVQRVEAWLNAFQPSFTPANLQVCTMILLDMSSFK